MAFLAAAAVPLAIAGGITSAVGTVMGGEATANAASYQAQVAANNAIVEEQNASYALAAGRAQAQATSMKSAATLGKIKTAQAANNVDVNSGSAKTVQESARETGQLDTETVMSNSELQAYGYRTQAMGYKAEQGLEEAKSEEAVPAALLSATGTLLSSASSVGFKWSGANPGAANAPLNILQQ